MNKEQRDALNKQMRYTSFLSGEAMYEEIFLAGGSLFLRKEHNYFVLHLCDKDNAPLTGKYIVTDPSIHFTEQLDIMKELLDAEREYARVLRQHRVSRMLEI